jgi:hypothetical protein
MKYLCLIYADPVIEQMPKAELTRYLEECAEFTDAIRQNGHYLGGDRLAHGATTVRVRQGRVSTTDGPFAETREQLGGYYLIDAKDLNEAIRVAARIPGARKGCVEVRPVAEG